MKLNLEYPIQTISFFPGETSLAINEIQPDPTENFSLDTTINFSENVRANEMFIYVEDNLNITSRLKANIGFHLEFIIQMTQVMQVYSNIYNNDNWSIQPRISARYLINDKWSVKGSYAEMTQNIHLLSNSSIGFPSDIWVPATNTVPSQTSKQWAGNISTEILNGNIELSP